MHWPFLLALALTFIFSFALGIFTLLINPRSRIHQLWFLTTMGVAIWSGGVFAIVWFTPDQELGLLLSKILHIGSTMLLIFFFHFLLTFLSKLKQLRGPLIFSYLLAVFFIISLFIPSLFLKGMTSKVGFDSWIDPGPLYWVYALLYMLCVLFLIKLLWQEHKKADGIKKRQIFYIFLAAIVGFGGGLTNFFPQLFNIYPFGTFVIFVYPVLITYGIFLQDLKIRV